jgi:hypothetical protein
MEIHPMCSQPGSFKGFDPKREPGPAPNGGKVKNLGGRKRKGLEPRLTRSIRIEPSKKIKLEKTFGSVQAWFDKKLEDEFKNESFETEVYEVEVIRKPKSKVKKSRKAKKEKISIDDF